MPTHKRTPMSVIRMGIAMRRKRQQEKEYEGLVSDLYWYLGVVPRTLFIAFLLRPFTIKRLCLWAKCRERITRIFWRLERRFLPRLTRSSLDQALVRAICRKEEHNVAIFLQRGAKPDQYLSRATPMLPYIVSCRSFAIVRLLVEAGANVEARNRETGETALMHAVKRNDVEMVKLLLHHGARADVRSSLGITPIVYSCWKGYTEAVRLLIAHGADPTRPAPDGNSAEDRARDNQHAEILEICAAYRNRLSDAPQR